jgi:multidrug efflux pump subunit AcrA (membrane-fusion protein)
VSELSASPSLQDSSEPVSELFQELPPLIARGLFYLVLLMLFVALVYSFFGSLDELVQARATAIPQGMVRPVQAAGGGRVTRVAVREGDPVTANQALIYLETETAAAQLERAQQQRTIKERQLQDLLAAKADALQIAEARSGLAQAQMSVTEAQRALDASIITAPVDGQVTRLVVRGTGETIQPGQAVAEIAPAGAPLVFLAQVANSDVGRVQLNQIVKLKVDAYPHQRYGVVDGRVTNIAPAAVTEGGMSAYPVTITPEPRKDSTAAKPISLRVGLAATAEIVTGRRRIIQLFIKTLRGES